LTTLPFEGGFPSVDAGTKLHAELQFQHAVQIYLWALPAMSLYSMRQAQEKQFWHWRQGGIRFGKKEAVDGTWMLNEDIN